MTWTPATKAKAERLVSFQHGHILTADDLNRLVSAIKDIDRRLAALERHCGPGKKA